MSNRIDSDLIEYLEEEYGYDDNFEQIIKGSPGRMDSKRLYSKGDRKRSKEERERRKQGHWNNLEMCGI